MVRRSVRYIFFLLLFTANVASATNARGVFDLSQHNFNQDGTVTLEGEAEFYWHEMLYPADFSAKKRSNRTYVPIPGIWNDFAADNFTNLSSDGYGTYRFKIILSDSNQRIAFKMPVINTAYRMYINGELVHQTGTPGKNHSEYKPRIAPGIFYYTATRDTLETVIQASNFDAVYGGITGNIKIGDPQGLRVAHNQRVFLDFFLLGALSIVSVYFFTMFLMYRREKWHLYFAVLCLFGMLLISTSGEFVISYLPGTSFQMLYRLGLISLFGSVTFLTLYIYNLFTIEYNKWVAVVVGSVSALGMIASAVFNAAASRYLVEPFLFFCIASILYKIVIITIAARKGKRGGKVFLIGFILLAAAVLHDILMNLNYVAGESLTGIGIFLFLISQTLVLSERFVRTIKKNELLTRDLNKINKNLEREVAHRTEKLNRSIKELQSAKKELNQSNEELRNVNETKNKYLSIIGHDLRGPVSGIKTALELIIEDLKEEKVNKKELEETLTALYESADSTFNLLVNLFQWARSQMGNIEYNPATFNLKENLEETLALMKNQLSGKQISTRTYIDPDIKVYADPNMVSTIFRNLISNAVKFSQPNSKIEFEAELSGKMVEISISDEGVGIPESKIPYLFEYSAKKSTRGTKKEKGTGIGLILVKEFVERNGGKISVHSTQDEGTVFIFSLPAAKGQESNMADPSDPEFQKQKDEVEQT